MKKVVFLVGNYGVGKSTLIKNKILDVFEDIFLQISEDWWVLGTDICGADSLSAYKKSDIMKKVEKFSHKGLIITGNYYCSHKDFFNLSGKKELHLVYLNTSFSNNAKRIAQRNGLINTDTYNQKLKSHINLIKSVKKLVKIHIIDNNQRKSAVKKEFNNIINKI